MPALRIPIWPCHGQHARKQVHACIRTQAFGSGLTEDSFLDASRYFHSTPRTIQYIFFRSYNLRTLCLTCFPEALAIASSGEDQKLWDS